MRVSLTTRTDLNAVAKSSAVSIQFSVLHSGSSRMRRVTEALDAWLQMFWMSDPVYPSVASAMRTKSMFLHSAHVGSKRQALLRCERQAWHTHRATGVLRRHARKMPMRAG